MNKELNVSDLILIVMQPLDGDKVNTTLISKFLYVAHKLQIKLFENLIFEKGWYGPLIKSSSLEDLLNQKYLYIFRNDHVGFGTKELCLSVKGQRKADFLIENYLSRQDNQKIINIVNELVSKNYHQLNDYFKVNYPEILL